LTIISIAFGKTKIATVRKDRDKEINKKRKRERDIEKYRETEKYMLNKER